MMEIGKPEGATSMSVWTDAEGRVVRVEYGYADALPVFRYSHVGRVVGGGGGRGTDGGASGSGRVVTE